MIYFSVYAAVGLVLWLAMIRFGPYWFFPILLDGPPMGPMDEAGAVLNLALLWPCVVVLWLLFAVCAVALSPMLGALALTAMLCERFKRKPPGVPQ